jgi:hypothetical protein
MSSCDHSGVFSDVGGTSLMTTSLLVLLDPEKLPSPTQEARNEVMLTVKIRQPSHEFTFGVGISFIPYLLVLTPVV